MGAILKIQDTYLDPITTNIYDLGTLTEQFKNLYIDGIAYIDGFGESTTLAEAVNIALGTTTGTKIGTATSQKLGFFNATPIIQPIATLDLGVVLSNLGLRAAGTAYPITTSGDITHSGDIIWTGESTGIPFAEIYVKDGSATIAVDADNPDVLVTQFTTNGLSNNCTADADNDKITITKAGKYLVNVTAVVSIDAGATTMITLAAYLNGNIQNNVHVHQSVVTAQPETNLHMSGIIDVTTVPWDLDLRANVSDTNARDLTFSDLNMNCQMVGGS